MSNSIILSAADILSASGHVGYQWDLKTDTLTWFGPWRSLFGADRANPPVNALELSTLILASDHHLIFNDTAPVFDRDYRLRGPHDEILWVHEHGTTDFEEGRAIRQQGLISILEKAGEQNAYRSVSSDRDALTGRPNRGCMIDLIDKIIKHPRENRKHTAYLVVGIDKLSLVNDAMGIRTVDHLICAVADRLNQICPTRAIVGRVGGDMFGILLPGLSKEMEPLAARILASFHDHAVSTQETSLHLNVCIGCLPFEETTGDAADLMIHAEQALHEARDIGHGQMVTYRDSERRAMEHRAVLDICEHVKHALKNNGVYLAYQPVVDAKTNEVPFYEVLARLIGSDGAPIPAGDFIPVVEQMGLAPEFDKHILGLAIHELESCSSLRLAVNISGITATHPEWPTYVENLLENRPDIARRLIIEITETAAIVDIAKMKNLVTALRGVGSELALDDFGAGSTSIRHLRDLDFAIMKIDRDLIINVTSNTEQQHLVRMLVAMAKGLGLRTVAEGIEEAPTADWLRAENVDLLQGYYLGRPSFDKPWQKAKTEQEAQQRDQQTKASADSNCPSSPCC